MTMQGSGSISGIPSFPNLQGSDATSIASDLQIAQGAYDTAKATFDAANILTESLRDSLLAARSSLQQAQEDLSTLQADPYATAAQIAAAEQVVATAQAAYNSELTAYSQAVSDFQTKADPFVAATQDLFAKTTEYVSALARQQMWNAQVNDTTVATLVSQLSAAFSSPDFTTPSWMLTAVAAAAPQASLEERNAIIDAFNAYRKLEYDIAKNRTLFIQSYINHLKAYYTWIANGSNPNDPLKAQSDFHWTQACGYQNQISDLIAQRPEKNQALDTAITSLGGALRTAFSYLRDATTLTETIMASFTQGYADRVAADAARLAAYLQQYPTGDAAFIAQRIAPYIAELIAAREAQSMPKSIEFPELPSITSNLSMSDLMRIVSKIQLMVQHLAAYVQDSNNRLGSFRIGSLILELDIEKMRTKIQQEWIATVKAADKAYNASVLSDNQQEIGEVLTSLSALQNPNVQSTINSVNAQITTWNNFLTSATAEATAFIQACKDIDKTVIDEINQARDTKPEAPNYLDFFDFDADAVAPSPLAYSSAFTGTWGTGLPLATLDPLNISELISQLTQIQSALPSGSTPSLQGALITANTDLQNLVESLSPALDSISRLLNSQGFDVTKLFLRETTPVRNFPTFSTTFFSQFAANIASLIEQSNIEEKDRAAFSKLIAELTQAVRSRSPDMERQEIGASGVGLGIEAASMEESPPSVSQLTSSIAQSEVLALSIKGTIDGAAMMAGLVTAGGSLAGLSSRLGISASEIFDELGISQATFLEQQSTQALLLAFGEQLALAASQALALRQNSVNVISQIPGGASLTENQVKEILAFLVMFQQLVLLFSSMLMAALAGMSSAQFLTQVLGNIGTARNMLSAFQALGLSQEKATALGISLGGDATDLQKILRSLGLDPASSTILLALIAAQKGNISLTEGVIGGPAFLDALLKRLKASGITISARIGTEEFMQQLTQALEQKATIEQKEILRAELSRERGIKQTSLEKAVEDLIKGIIAARDTAKTEGIAPERTVISPIIHPSEVFAQYTEAFRTFPQNIQDKLIGIAQGSLGGIEGISNEQKAALLLAVRLGITSVTEAILLSELARRESGGTLAYGALETGIISKLFQVSPEARLAREESLKRAILNEEIRLKELLPNALPQRIVDDIQISFKRVINTFEDRKFAIKVTENFSQFVEKLSNMSKVGVMLLDPGKVLLRLFSVILTTSQDRLRQPPTLFGG